MQLLLLLSRYLHGSVAWNADKKQFNSILMRINSILTFSETHVFIMKYNQIYINKYSIFIESLRKTFKITL